MSSRAWVPAWAAVPLTPPQTSSGGIRERGKEAEDKGEPALQPGKPTAATLKVGADELKERHFYHQSPNSLCTIGAA